MHIYQIILSPDYTRSISHIYQHVQNDNRKSVLFHHNVIMSLKLIFCVLMKLVSWNVWSNKYNLFSLHCFNMYTHSENLLNNYLFLWFPNYITFHNSFYEQTSKTYA